MAERTEVVQARIKTISEQLKRAYDAPDLTVVASSNNQEFDSILLATLKPDFIKRGRNPAAHSGFQMVFIPGRNTVDGAPYIVVRAERYAPDNHLRNELTHEFSNYEAERRWGSELGLYSARSNNYLNYVGDQYFAQVQRESNLLGRIRLMLGKHQSLNVYMFSEMYWHSIWDAPSSVPADYISVEKGYDSRLKARKKKKIKEVVEVNRSMDHRGRMLLFSVSLPHYAYWSFHPSDLTFEREAESGLTRYLDIIGAPSSLLEPIRSMREALHEIRTPIIGEEIFKVLQKIAVIYFAIGEQNSQKQSRRYWGILREVAERS